MQQKACEMIKGLEHMALEERKGPLCLEGNYRKKKVTPISEVIPMCKAMSQSPQRKFLLI